MMIEQWSMDIEKKKGQDMNQKVYIWYEAHHEFVLVQCVLQIVVDNAQWRALKKANITCYNEENITL